MRELRLLASARSAGTHHDRCRAATSPVDLATPDAFEGVDIALFCAGGGTSKELAPEAAAARRGRDRQLERLADGPGRAARGVAGQPGRPRRGTRGSSPTPTAPRCS